MKKIAITVCAFAFATCAFAQKKNVSGAEGKLYEPMDLNGAKTMIEAAMKDPTTINQTKTYWVAAQVYEKLYEEQEKNRQLGKSYSQDVENEVLIKAVDAYKRTSELDVLPDEKGKIKPKYTKIIPARLDNYKNYLINAGLANYNSATEKKNPADYSTAVDLWAKYIEMADYPVMEKLNMKADTLYNEIKYYSINAAMNTTDRQDVAVKYMEDLKSTTKYGQTMYEWLYSTYQKQGNDDKMVSVLKEAVEKYPSNNYFIGSLINYYLANKKDAEAVAYVDEAISKDPKNVQYYLIKSNLYLQKEDYEKGIDVAKQAISIDGNNFDANYYCGLAYIKKAENAMMKADKIKDNAKYKVAKNLAIDQFKNAIPYLEKARTINGKDLSNLNLLKTAYYRSGNGAKYTEIDNEMKKLQ